MGYQPPFYVYTDNLTILGNGTKQNPLYARFPDLYITQNTVIAEPTDYNFVYITNNATLTLGSGSSTPAQSQVVSLQIDSGSTLILNSVQLQLLATGNVLINGNIVSTNSNDLIIINTPTFTLNGNILLTGNIQIGNYVTLQGGGQILPIIYSITITNSQSSATPAPFQQMVQIPSTYIPYIRFTDSSGNLIYTWLESISSGTATIWVKLPNGINTNSSITIYVIGYNSGFDGNYWGEAPNLSPTYGQYDNGANVFGAYDNFAGTSLSPQWASVNSPTITVNNGITVAGNGQTGGIYLKTKYPFPAVLEAYSGNTWGYAGFMFVNDINGAPYSYNGWWSVGSSSGEAYNGVTADPWGTNTGGNAFQYAINGTSYAFGSSVSSIILNNIVSIYSSGSTVGQLINYGSTNSQSISASLPSTTYNIEIGVANGETITLHWIRYRAYPPNGVMPSTSVTTNTTPTLTVNSGNTLTVNGNLTFGVNIASSGAITINSGYTLTLTDAVTLSISAINNNGTLNIQSSLTINNNITFSNTINFTSSSSLTINSGYTLTLNGNTTFAGSSISGSGTLAISSGYTLTINTNITLALNLAGSGTISVSSGYTLTLNMNYTITSSSVQFSGSGTLNINSGYTLTISNNVTWTLNLTGSGTINVNSGYILTINANITVSIPTITGSGTLSVNSGYTLTQSASITLSVPTVNIAGTWANNGYGITIPSGSTVTVTVTGSLTTSSSAGTLTVDGTCYWFGNITAQTGSSYTNLPSFPLSLTGSGIFIGAPANSGNGTNTVSLSNTAISPGGTHGAVTFQGKIPYYNISGLSGSAVGQYGIGIYGTLLDNTGTYGCTFVLVYIGTANTTYNINSALQFALNTADNGAVSSGGAYNCSSSAGTITITGTLYV